jgi:DNA (cytosine-5)-methyltransferase 1
MKHTLAFDLTAEGREISVLNLYSGIGGNRKLWPDNVRVTAVEYNEEIAAIYKEYFPQDEVIITDAHKYLLENYKRFDFIWTSPPCQTHSKIRAMGVRGGYLEPKFIDMKLWQEIVFLQNFCKCKFVVENVEPYYEPFVQPTAKMQRHFFWANFKIKQIQLDETGVIIKNVSANDTVFGFSLKGRKLKHRKDQILRNCVNPELGLHVFNCAVGAVKSNALTQTELWNTTL